MSELGSNQLSSGSPRRSARTSPRLVRGEAGFSLIEAMAASTIMMVVLFALLSAAIQARALLGADRHRTGAAQVGQWWGDSLLQMPASDARLAPGEHKGFFDADGKLLSETAPSADSVFSVTWTVTPEKPALGFIEIALRVERLPAGSGLGFNAVTYRAVQ